MEFNINIRAVFYGINGKLVWFNAEPLFSISKSFLDDAYSFRLTDAVVIKQK
jgi:hypothetical protein